MKTCARLAGMAVLLLTGLAALADPPAGYPFVDYDQGLSRARAEGRPLLVYFGRHGCSWCERTNREAFGDPRLRELYPRRFVLVYVDTEGGKRLTLPGGERITERELGARLKVLATPVFAFLEPDGREIFRIAGIQSARDFLLYDRFVNDGFYKQESIREFLGRELR